MFPELPEPLDEEMPENHLVVLTWVRGLLLK